MSGAKASKFVQAVVDRVVNDVVVAMIRHPDAAEDEPDTFKEIYIPGERFKEPPNEYQTSFGIVSQALSVMLFHLRHSSCKSCKEWHVLSECR